MKPDYYNEAWYQKWFGKGSDVDQEIKDKFAQDIANMKTGKLDEWKTKSPFECLAGDTLPSSRICRYEDRGLFFVCT